MGYNTDYEGTILFRDDITVKELRFVQRFLGKDFREMSNELKSLLPKDSYLTYIDLELTDDLAGVQWDRGTEKSHDLIDALNLIQRACIAEFGGSKVFASGKFLCQGEDIEDRYFILLDEYGFAYREDISVECLITCPDCGCRFELGS
jgi:hypothetical protein